MPAPNIPGAIVSPIRERQRTTLEQIAMSLAAQAPQLAYMLMNNRGGADPAKPSFEQLGQANFAAHQNMQDPNSPTRQAMIGAGIGNAATSSADIASLHKDRLAEQPYEYAMLEEQRARVAVETARDSALKAARKMPAMQGEKGQQYSYDSILNTYFQLEDAGTNPGTINLIMGDALANAPSARNLLAYSRDKFELETAKTAQAADAYATQRFGEIVGDEVLASGEHTINGAGGMLQRIYAAMYESDQQKGVDLYKEMVDFMTGRVGTKVGGMDPMMAMQAAGNDLLAYKELISGTEITIDQALQEALAIGEALDPTGEYAPVIARLDNNATRREVYKGATIVALEEHMRDSTMPNPETGKIPLTIQQAEENLRKYIGKGSWGYEDGTPMLAADKNYILNEVLKRYRIDNPSFNVIGGS